MLTRTCIYQALYFAIIKSIATIGQNFWTTYQLKQKESTQTFKQYENAMEKKIGKVSSSIYVIIKGNKALFLPDLTFKWRSVLPQ